MRLILVPLLAAAALATNAVAQLYSWKDADGKVQYSDEPPPGKTPARKVAAPPAPSVAPAAVRRAQAEREIETRKRSKEAGEAAAKAEKDRAEAEDRRVNCERAKGNLQALESGQTRFTSNAKGERVALEGSVLEDELASARRAAAEWCK